MPQTTPRRVAQIARPVALVSSPVAPGVMLAWVTEVWTQDRPMLAVMVFTFALCVTLAAAMVWATAVCHLAIAKAFTAGVEVGRQQAPRAPVRPAQVDLRVVE